MRDSAGKLIDEADVSRGVPSALQLKWRGDTLVASHIQSKASGGPDGQPRQLGVLQHVSKNWREQDISKPFANCAATSSTGGQKGTELMPDTPTARFTTSRVVILLTSSRRLSPRNSSVLGSRVVEINRNSTC